MSIQEFSVEEGFSDRNFYMPFQDKEGFIWVGTPFGLDKFDGNKVKHYSTSEHGLPYNSIFRLLQDDQGVLWLFSEKANGVLLTFDPVSATAQNLTSYLGINNKISESEITWVSQGPAGNLLIITSRGKIYEWANQKLSLKHTIQREQQIYQIFEPKKGSFWVNGENILLHFNKDWSLIDSYAHKQLPNNEIYNLGYNIIEDNDGRLHSISWPHDEELRKKLGQSFLMKHHVNGKLYRDLSKLYKSASLGVEPGTLNEYLFKEDRSGNHKIIYKSPDGTVLGEHPITGFSIRSSLLDRQNNLWIVSQDGLYLISVQQNPFSNYLQNQKGEVGTYFSARGIIEDDKGHLFINGAGSTQKIDRKTGSKETLIPAYTSASYKDDFGNIWTTEESFILYKYSTLNESLTSYGYTREIYDRDGEKYGYPQLNRAIIRDSNQKVWMGHAAGLSYLDEETGIIKHLTEGDMASFSKTEVFFMLEKPEGIWLGTSNGLYLFDKTAHRILKHYHSKADGEFRLPFNIIAHIYEDTEGIFWLASKGGGLIRWDRETKTFASVTTNNGLSNNVIYAVYEDSYKNLWLPSNIGISQYNKVTGEVIQYGQVDGLPHNEFNTASHYQGKDSTLYFGGLNGVTSFKPNEIIRNRLLTKTPLYFTGLKKQNRQDGLYKTATQEFLKTHSISLKPEDVGFQLEFSHLDFKFNSNKQYAYLIEGIDGEWNYINESVIKINALPYGKYQLKVKASQSNDTWSDEHTIPIYVHRPIYLQIWFIITMLLLLVVLIYLFIKIRLRKSKRDQERLENEVKLRTTETREQADKLSVQASELKKLDTAKSQFFANISHELRTPLTLIMGPVDQLLQDKSLNQEQLKQLQRMAGNGRNLAKLVEEILELSRLEAGNLSLKEVPISLKPFLGRIFAAYESMAQRKGVAYTADYNFNEHISAMLDVGKVEKIINNLISNALKFTRQDGQVTFSASLEQNILEIEVKDNGIGIASEDLPLIFNRFFQSQVKRAANLQGGTGIGLALVKELCEAMSGSVTVKSQRGKGAHFTVTIPIKKIPSILGTSELDSDAPEGIEAITTPVAETEEPSPILLVEDNPDMSDYISQLLEPHYKVTQAGHGKEALEILRHQRVDLIISDVMMPEMDGFTLLQILKSSEHFHTIPVIMLTARADDRNMLDALNTGVDDYLTKPFIAEELKARVKNRLFYSKMRTPNLLTAGEIISEATSDTDKESTTVDLKWLRKLKKAVLVKLTDHDFSMDILAEDLEISTRQMRRRIKESTGMTPNQYVQELRLELSRSYLENLAYSNIAEVSQAVGFNSTKYFSKLFKERYGKNPSDYLP